MRLLWVGILAATLQQPPQQQPGSIEGTVTTTGASLPGEGADVWAEAAGAIKRTTASMAKDFMSVLLVRDRALTG